MAGTLGANNPLRYRGYVYDRETGLYYLQSRYYNPKIGRFINADAFTSTGQGLLGNNMFAYCRNNPVCRIDISGTADADCVDESNEDWEPFDDAGRGGGGGGSAWCTTLGAIDGVTFGFNMAMGSGVKGISSGMHQTCFIAGTLIQTEEGTISIEEIQEGDMVWAWNEETGEVALKKVVETYINETTELIHVFVNGEEIITTPTHPFYSPVKGWTDAAHLRAGDILVLVNGEYVVVERVQHEILEAPILVYNFQVEDFHTYYVSNAGVLVHNACGKPLKVYDSVKQSPDYNSDFQKAPNGTKKVNIKNTSLHSELNQYGRGWKKVYSDGYLWGNQASLHYFQDISGKVFGIKYVSGWSVLK